jgi:hypothetical protein
MIAKGALDGIWTSGSMMRVRCWSRNRVSRWNYNPRARIFEPEIFECTYVTLLRDDIQRAAYTLGRAGSGNFLLSTRPPADLRVDGYVSINSGWSLTSISGPVVVYACKDARHTTHYRRSDTINTLVDFLEDQGARYCAARS